MSEYFVIFGGKWLLWGPEFSGISFYIGYAVGGKVVGGNPLLPNLAWGGGGANATMCQTSLDLTVITQ